MVLMAMVSLSFLPNIDKLKFSGSDMQSELFRVAHLRSLYAGLQLTFTTIRQDYWILRARHLVRSIIHRCVVCTRERARIPTQLIGDLLYTRVNPPTRAFVHYGLDYAGPVLVRALAGRGVTVRKIYIAIFICLASRAVHLELVDGSRSYTPAFIAAYSRFCSCRGLPETVHSDNGTTFIGANRELTLAFRAALRNPNFQNRTAGNGVTWKFIPPSAPHFGGLWEAEVRSVKYHLRRVLRTYTLTFEEFTTLLCYVEACLNLRPLGPLTDSLDDFESLTPGNFLNLQF
ncbi:uncharacterized protein LOC116850253 [Odontomachus brunneus]|uniref:uncharacterized protein LOC116850253 n=1 Tax=Odontomachus brunneus TaxID=486640 RepID=UPI0013F1E533|nr:uncharacterized protein LOC116850253 [Odontomachus brunneus]